MVEKYKIDESLPVYLFFLDKEGSQFLRLNNEVKKD